jgi:hypothetical protein
VDESSCFYKLDERSVEHKAGHARGVPRGWLADVIDELGTRKEIEYAFEILKNGGSAARQVATFQQSNDLKAVVDQLIRETEEGVVEGKMA